MENAATAYRDALSVYTQASLPGRWADLQLQLGITLHRASLFAPQNVVRPGSRVGGCAAARLAGRCPRTISGAVGKPEVSAGADPAAASRLSRGQRREALRRDAQSFAEQRQPVYARLRRAGSYGQAMLELAEVCLELQDRACATASALAAYAADPKNHEIYGGLVRLLQERMFDTERMIAIHRDHAARYPESLPFQPTWRRRCCRSGTLKKRDS